MSSITKSNNSIHFNDKLVDNIINRRNDVLDVKFIMDDYIDNYYNNNNNNNIATTNNNGNDNNNNNNNNNNNDNNNNNNNNKTSYCACQALLSTFHCLDGLIEKNLVVGLEEKDEEEKSQSQKIDNNNDNNDANAILGRCCMIMRSLLDDINEAIIKSDKNKNNKEGSEKKDSHTSTKYKHNQEYDDDKNDDDDDDDTPLSNFLMAYDEDTTATTTTSYFSNEIYSNSSHIFQNLSILRDEAIIQGNIKDIKRISDFIGNVLSRYYISRKVCSSSEGLSFWSKRGRRHYKPIINQWIMASSPARIDLSGGWTDTPPICYEFGCHVTGMAVTIDNTKPLMCRCRIVTTSNNNNNNNKGAGGIYLCTESRQLGTGKLLSSNEIEINCIEDLKDFKQPNANCSLLKSCLIHLGIIDSSSSDDNNNTTMMMEESTMEKRLQPSSSPSLSDNDPNNPTTGQNNLLFQQFVNEFCFSSNSSINHHHYGDNNNTTTNVRLELVSTSLLPQGSGLGTSSILAGCALAALSEVIGITKLRRTTTTTINNNDDDDKVRSEKEEENNKQQLYHDLIDSVSNVEQLLTSGGGFQDQVNGLIGGIKTVTVKNPNMHPMKLDIDRIDFTTSSDDDDGMHHFLQQLEMNTILVFTGKTRLAKNLLDCVLNRWAKRTSEIVNNVQNLVDNSLQCSKSIIGRDLDGLGVCLKKYWTQKKIMAGGKESGVEPTMISNAINALYDENLIRGASLCGAGGGGFMVLLTNDGISKADIENAISNHLKEEKGGGLDHRQQEEQDEEDECSSTIPSSSSYHTTQICKEGLTVKNLNNITSSDEFDIKWLLQSSPTAATLN